MIEPRPADVVFTCGSATGGSPASTLTLARAATAAGLRTLVVRASADGYGDDPLLLRVTAKVTRQRPSLDAGLWPLVDRALRRRHRWVGDELVADDVPSVVSGLDGNGPLVVASHRRLDLQRLLTIGERRGGPVVWYVRERPALRHVSAIAPRAAVTMANSAPLASEIERLTGRACAVVPSPIDTSALPTDGRGEELSGGHVLVVNPIASHGLHLVAALADAMPDVDFLLQRSWPLSAAELRSVESVARRANVTVRAPVDRSELFTGAEVLLLAHTGPALALSRPRLAMEASWCGVPVVAADTPGLRDVVPHEDAMVGVDAGPQAWTAALRRVMASRGRRSAEAADWADRALPTPDRVWAQFAANLEQVGVGEPWRVPG